MTEWGVVSVLVVISGLVISIVTPIIKLNTVITKLSAVVENIRHALDKNDDDIKELWEHNDRQDDRITDHEQRLLIIEHDSHLREEEIR